MTFFGPVAFVELAFAVAYYSASTVLEASASVRPYYEVRSSMPVLVVIVGWALACHFHPSSAVASVVMSDGASLAWTSPACYTQDTQTLLLLPLRQHAAHWRIVVACHMLDCSQAASSYVVQPSAVVADAVRSWVAVVSA